MKNLNVLFFSFLFLLVLSFPPSTLSFRDIIALDDCTNVSSSICSLSFILDDTSSNNGANTRNVLRNETISLSTWSKSLIYSNNTELSLPSSKGRCDFNTETTSLTVYPLSGTNYAVCTFEIQPNSNALPIQISQKDQKLPSFTLPSLLYYESPFKFIPFDDACTDPFTFGSCNGLFSIPSGAVLSTIIKSTSLITTSNPLITLKTISKLPITPTESVYSYTISPQPSLLIDSVLVFDVMIEQSSVSPFLEFHLTQSTTSFSTLEIEMASDHHVAEFNGLRSTPEMTSESNLVSETTDKVHFESNLISETSTDLHSVEHNTFETTSSLPNTILIATSPIPIWSYIPSLGIGTNCSGRRDNLCTISFEVNRYLPKLDQLRLTPTGLFYLKPHPTDDIHECTSADHVPTTIGRDDGYVMMCQTFRKTIHTTQHRASLKNQFKMLLSGPYINEILTYPLTGIYYFSPIWVDWDEELCRDPDVPICVAIVKSTYNHGPPISLEVFLPFSENFDRVECNTNLLSVTGTAVDLPSRNVAHNELQYIELTEDTPMLICNVYFVIGYKTEYIYNNIDGQGTNIPIILESYREGIDPVIREGFGASIIIPDRENLYYNAFPLTISPKSNCKASLIEYCTLDFIITDPSQLHEENYIRPFVVDVPGLDEEYTLTKGGFSLSLSNYHATQSIVTLYPLKANTVENPTSIDRTGFEISLKHLYKKHIAIDDDLPLVVSLTYRKAPNQNLVNQIPHFVSYGTIPLGQQPPVADLLPEHPDGITVVFRAIDTLLYQANCDDERNQFCTMILTRWSQEVPLTYFDFTFTDSTSRVWSILELTGFDDDMMDFVTTPIFLDDGTMRQMIDWKQFKNDPLDENEPLPTSISLHLRKPLGYSGIFSIIVYPDKTSADPDNMPPDQYVHERESRFKMDGQPIFAEDCSSFTSPYCSVTYSTYSTIIPNGHISIHPVEDGIIHSVELIRCDNVQYVDDGEGILVPPFAITLSRNGDEDYFETIHPSDFISFFSTSSLKVTPTNPLLPITCSARYTLQNKVSKVMRRIAPYRVMDQDQSQLTSYQFPPISIPLPRMAWAPVIVNSLQDCSTSAIFTSTCTLKIAFYGTKADPVRELLFDLPDSFVPHPLIPDSTYNMYLMPLTKARLANPVVSDNNYVVAQFFIGYNPEKGLREFKFTVFDVEYQQKYFESYIVFENQVTDTTISFPSFALPVNVNGIQMTVNPNLHIPTMVSGPVVSVYHNQSVFSRPGVVKTTMEFAFEVTGIQINTNFGNSHPIPCIQTYSDSILTGNSILRPELVGYAVYKQIIETGTRAGGLDVEKMKQGQITALDNLTKSGLFTHNNQLISPRIIGWLSPYDQKEKMTRWVPNKFGDGANYKVLNQECDYFTGVNRKYPTERNAIQHSISVSTPNLTNDVMYLFQYYPGYEPTARLMQADPI